MKKLYTMTLREGSRVVGKAVIQCEEGYQPTQQEDLTKMDERAFAIERAINQHTKLRCHIQEGKSGQRHTEFTHEELLPD